MSGSALTASIPWLLVAFRGLCAPPLLWLCVGQGWSLVAGLLIGLTWLSDWIDGVLARRWNVVTANLRRMDSRADVAFYVNVLAVGLWAHGEMLRPWFPFLISLLVLEGLCQVISQRRFGQGTATHAYLCKAWSVSLAIAAVDLFGRQEAGWPLTVCVTMGFVAYLDVLAILLMASRPPVDVPSAWHAWRQREAGVTPGV